MITKIPNLIIVICLLALVACNNQESQVNARIFERREIDSNQLMIRYQYTFDEKVYEDSAVIPNHVIGSDSIEISIRKSSPTKSKPSLLKSSN